MTVLSTAPQREHLQSTPRVSIGLPVYNGDNFLAETLDSLLSQTYINFELIISDNGSTDQTVAMCQAYAAKDRRIRFYPQNQNRGATWNYNRVFALARGEYFKWAAHDDLCTPYYLERCVKILDYQPEVVLCFPQTVIIDEQGQFVEHYDNRFAISATKPHQRLRTFLRGPGLCNPIFGLMRRSVLQKTTLIESYAASDRVLLGQLALHGQFFEIAEPLFQRRLHPQTSVKANQHAAQRARWFDPTLRRAICFPTWRRVAEYLRAVWRAEIDFPEKVLCYGVLGRRYLLHPTWMIRDFQAIAQSLSLP